MDEKNPEEPAPNPPTGSSPVVGEEQEEAMRQERAKAAEAAAKEAEKK